MMNVQNAMGKKITVQKKIKTDFLSTIIGNQTDN